MQRALKKNPFEWTVNLPKTTFPMRANAAQNEIKYRHRCTDQLYQWQRSALRDRSEFVLLDGPPYANGDLHIGHALNKILKDIIVRWNLLSGKRVHFRPGWDCHGLPIELKALQAVKASGSTGPLSASQIRKCARETALNAVNAQRDQFKSWAVMADWDNSYLTLQPQYEAAQLEIFRKMFNLGLIYRKYRPVYWSPWTQTALAEAELEYNENHKSRSVYVRMEIEGLDKTYLLIWTTTPWTLPGNKAVAINTDLRYVTVEDSESGCRYIIAEDLLDSTLPKISEDPSRFEIVEPTDLSALMEQKYRHPIYHNQSCPVISASYVTADAGTGLVHIAPAHGFDDYIATLEHTNIGVDCTVDERGRYTGDAGESLEGLSIFKEGVDKVLEIAGNNVLKEEIYTHKYPYDWRTNKPVIVRATAQWFADVSEIKGQAVDSLKYVEFLPKSGRKRLSTIISARNEWCISRQRSWGVPIPSFYSKETGEPLMNDEVISKIINITKEGGSDVWFEKSISELLPDGYNPELYEKGTDTMDVWFDSGCAWSTLLEKDIADIYLEGSDQHRGWFQSSLLTSIATRNHAPYKQVITHGFVTDDKNRKMSKSIGNVIDPSFITDEGKNAKNKKPNLGYGVDVMRLWISSSDFTRDISVGSGILKNVAESLRKIRNTSRFLISNLYDFNPDEHLVETTRLTPTDAYMLNKLHKTVSEINQNYQECDFAKVYSILVHYSTTELSSFYFDIAKHPLFNSAHDSHERRSIQTVFYHTLRHLMTTIAPITPHLSEEIFEHYKQIDKNADKYFSVFEFAVEKEMQHGIPSSWHNPYLENDVEILRALRDKINFHIEDFRQKKEIGSSMEAHVCLRVNKGGDILKRYGNELTKFFIVASHEVVKNENRGESVATFGDDDQTFIDLSDIVVSKSKMHKCIRCRAHVSPQENDLCIACEIVVKSLDETVEGR